MTPVTHDAPPPDAPPVPAPPATLSSEDLLRLRLVATQIESAHRAIALAQAQGQLAHHALERILRDQRGLHAEFGLRYHYNPEADQVDLATGVIQKAPGKTP